MPPIPPKRFAEGAKSLPPHPATVALPRRSTAGRAERPPHPATVTPQPHPAAPAQPKEAAAQRAARPHPATGTQPGRPFGRAVESPPHPATVAQRRSKEGAAQPFFEFLVDALSAFGGGSHQPYTPEVLEVPRVASILGVERTLVGLQEKLRVTYERAESSGLTHRWSITSGKGLLFAQLNERGGLAVETPHLSVFFVGKGEGPVTIRVECRDDGGLVTSATHEIAVYKSHTIPKLIHFVWAGGTKPMPEKTFSNVKDWAKKNKAYGVTVCIWVDKKTDPEVLRRYEATQGIQLVDITEAGLCSSDGKDPVRYEIDRLWPNYGASSDLLRYRILHKYGGAYFDSDVFPGDMPLGATFAMASGAFSDFMVSENSQNTGMIGNDTFVCAKGSSVIEAIHDQAMKNYKEVENQSYRYNNAEFYDDYLYKRESTIRRTGPTCVRNTLRALGLASPNEKLKSDIHRIPSGIVKIPEHESNTEGWLKVPITKMKLSDAVVAAASSMRFEIQHMGMFRTVDHVAQVAASAGIELKNVVKLQDYTGNFFTIQPKSDVTEIETQISESLLKYLDVESLDLSLAKYNWKTSGGVTCEPRCRYKAFEELYNAITGK